MTGGHARGSCPFTCEQCSAERQRCKQDKKKKNRQSQLRFDDDFMSGEADHLMASEADAYLVSKGKMRELIVDRQIPQYIDHYGKPLAKKEQIIKREAYLPVEEQKYGESTF